MTVEELYAAYVAERPRFLRLARRVCRLLEDRVLAEGVGGVDFEFRAKEALSYVRKALVKGYGDPLREATDLAGVRATCLYLTTCERVESIIKREFIVVDTVDKRDLLGPDRLGYGGKHFIVHLRRGRASRDSRGKRVCEIQVRTRGEDAWARVSHETLYKGDVGSDRSLQRRINRLSALTEIFDSEATNCYQAMIDQQNYPRGQMIEAIDRNFLLLGGRHLSDELTLAVVDTLLPLYDPQEVQSFGQLVDRVRAGQPGRLDTAVWRSCERRDDSDPNAAGGLSATRASVHRSL